MQIVWLIIIGAAAGFIATRIMNVQLGTAQTIAVGVIGALVGGFLLRLGLAALGAAGGLHRRASSARSCCSGPTRPSSRTAEAGRPTRYRRETC